MLSILHKKIPPIFLVVCLLCIAFNVNGQAITISPSSITVEMTGGDILTRNLTFSHDSDSDMPCHISFEILPDGEGINVSFSQGESFVLKPGDTVINITINISDSIMPMTYTINIYANAEEYVPDGNGESGSKRRSSITIVEPVNDTVNDSSDPADETPDDTLLLDDEPPEADPPSSWLSRYYMQIILIVILITILITLLILYWIRRRKKKNET